MTLISSAGRLHWWSRFGRSASTVDSQLLKRAVELLAKELPPGRAASIAAQLTGASRSQAYELLKPGRLNPNRCVNEEIPRRVARYSPGVALARSP